MEVCSNFHAKQPCRFSGRAALLAMVFLILFSFVSVKGKANQPLIPVIAMERTKDFWQMA